MRHQCHLHHLKHRLLIGSLCFATVALVGCESKTNGNNPNDKKKLGDTCAASAECEPNLVCAGDSTCRRPGDPGTSDLNEQCSSKESCIKGLVCSAAGVCAPAGTGRKGDPCVSSGECAAEFVCSSSLKCASPGDPGTTPNGGECARIEDCALGLICLSLAGEGSKGACSIPPVWQGATCAAKDDGPARVYFEIPRGAPLAEFYRQPFPSNVRLKNGRVDVSGHPNPGIDLPQGLGDIAGEYLKTIKEDVRGFGLNTTVLMRFSKQVDFDTLVLNDDSSTAADERTIRFFDIAQATKGCESGNKNAGGISFNMFAETGRKPYICQNYIALRPPSGSPLSSETTYAALIMKGIMTDVKDGETSEALGQDEDFALMLNSTAPTDADELAAWNAYAPLRDFVTKCSVDPQTIIGGAVFTTMNPRYRMAKLREAVQKEAEPVADKLTLCDGTKVSPCDDQGDATRKCLGGATAAAGKFHEIHGTYKTPVYQKGTAPYLLVKDGGGIEYNAKDEAQKQRDDDTCFALTVPKGDMPSAGWPIVIYAHGTNGNFRSFIDDGTAGELADIRDGNNSLSKMAAISIDGSMHGPRRNSEDSPDTLFFNLRNPRAARDNVYQGAIDKFQLLRLIKKFQASAQASPTGAEIKFDTSKIYFFGHSQGTVEGIPFVAAEPDVKAVVLSGAGGFLLESLLNKRKPVDIASIVKFALLDFDVNLSHPLLNLLQLLFEEVDSVNYGRAIFRTPESGINAKHLFLSYGVDDSYTPPAAIDAFGRAMQIKMLDQKTQHCGDGVCSKSLDCVACAADCSSCGGAFTFTAASSSVSGNETGGITAALAPYKTDGKYDGHFVVFQNPEGRRQSMHFLGTAEKNTTPTIPAAQ